jgi:pimeloyl-ACP methyl ester carboxylesterase
VRTEQVYVEKLTPQAPSSSIPIIFWTGLGQTGTNWLNTPDGRAGWASYFLSKGYVVYLADQPIRGRSPFLPVPYNDTNTQQSVITSTYVRDFWTGTQYLTYPLWPQARLHTQWPGTGLPGDDAFENFVAAAVPSLLNQTLSEELSRKALGALLSRIASPSSPVILVTHSAGGPHGFVAADDHPELLHALISIEPQGPPFVNAVIRSSGPGIVRPYGITQTPIKYDPPLASPSEIKNVTISAPAAAKNGSQSDCVLQASPPRRLSNLAKVLMLVVTSEAGYHAVYDRCTVGYLRQAGVQADWMDLPQDGINGNGHFMFMELNNEKIAEKIEAWINISLL